MLTKVSDFIIRSKYVLITIIIFIVYKIVFRGQLPYVLDNEMVTIVENYAIEILIALYSLSFVVVTLVTILTSKGNYILWIDIVEYQLVDNKYITLKDMYFLLVIMLSFNTISCFSDRITECVIGYTINILFLFFMIYYVLITFYIKKKVITRLQYTYRLKSVEQKREILDKLYFMCNKHVENKDLSKIEEAFDFVENLLVFDYKILDYLEKYFINIYIFTFKFTGRKSAKILYEYFYNARKKLWISTSLLDAFLEKIVRLMINNDIIMTSICCSSHASIHKVYVVRDEIYLRLSKIYERKESIELDNKRLLCRMYLGMPEADDVLNMMVNDESIVCILYEYIIKLLDLGLKNRDYDILNIIDNAMDDIRSSALKKILYSISYNKTREYKVQWEKYGDYTLFADFFYDLEMVFEQINLEINEQNKIKTGSIYGNKNIGCLNSIKNAFYQLIVEKIIVIECDGKNTEFNIHFQDVRCINFVAVIKNQQVYAPHYQEQLGLKYEIIKSKNSIHITQNNIDNKCYLVFLKEYNFDSKNDYFRNNIIKKHWKIPNNRFRKNDYKYIETEDSRLKKRQRMII